MTDTLLSLLVQALQNAAGFNSQTEVAPAVVLWTDSSSQWLPVLPRLREMVPHLLTWGDFDAPALTGPSIWLRCMIARTLPEADWEGGAVPIVYLPGIAKTDLSPDCQPNLGPLIELQYRGTLWTQPGGRDWGVVELLQDSSLGAGIEVAADEAAQQATRDAVSVLAELPLATLKARSPLTAARIHQLLVPDVVENILGWLNSPAEIQGRLGEVGWEAFCSSCRADWGFDPVTEGPLVAADLLGRRDHGWEDVWQRFAYAPRRYPKVPAQLDAAYPNSGSSGLFYHPSSWPKVNQENETALRDELTALKGFNLASARSKVRKLETVHGPRRGWVWAELGQAPLAWVLSELVALVDATELPAGGDTPAALAAAYTQGGWRADAAVLAALKGVETAVDVTAVRTAVDALYRAWLRDGADRFQAAVAAHPLPGKQAAASPPAGCCLLFADGLRYDLGEKLAAELRRYRLGVTVDWCFGALPGVTPTAKPAISPVASLLAPGADYETVVAQTGVKVVASVMKNLMAGQGIAVLDGADTGTDIQREGIGWTECGKIDSNGHAHGVELPRYIEAEMLRLRERVQALLAAGWREVRVNTDHGWLLLPGGLPKAEMPAHLTTKRKLRCARLNAASSTDVQTVPWYWDDTVRIAMAPGVSCFEDGAEYDHGGLSLQECVVPVLTVTANSDAHEGTVSLKLLKWRGMRCDIEVSGGRPGMTAVMRIAVNDSKTAITGHVPLKEDTKITLTVADPDFVASEAFVVIVNAAGEPVAKLQVIVGGLN